MSTHQPLPEATPRQARLLGLIAAHRRGATAKDVVDQIGHLALLMLLPALVPLEWRGWIVFTDEGRKERRYHISDEGLRALRRFVTTHPDPRISELVVPSCPWAVPTT